jgi:hypothetical protein
MIHEYEQLKAHNAKRPFAPFWLTLTDGETIYITEPNTAVVMPKQFVFTPDRRKLRWIPFDKIASHGPLKPAGDEHRREDAR